MRTFRALALAALSTLAGCMTTTEGEIDTTPSNAIVDADITRRIGELKYQHGPELLQSMTTLARMGEAAAPRLREGLRSEDWLTRASLAWVMGATSDRRYIPDLRAAIGDPVAGVRYEVASALVELGDATGFPPLVAGLSDADVRNRYKCFESLRRATGRDFGYQHDASPETRRAAIVRWNSWLESLRASAL